MAGPRLGGVTRRRAAIGTAVNRPDFRGPAGRDAAYRGLAPVRLDGSRDGRITFGTRPRQGPWRRLLRLGGRLFGPGSPLRHLDWILLLAVFALAAVGVMLIWAATGPGRPAMSDPDVTKQVLSFGIGLVLMVAVSMLDYRQLKLYSPVVMVLACLGLLAVLSPLGRVVNGAKSWIDLPAGFQVEPSEYAKLAIILVSAMILSNIPPGEDRPRIRSVAKAVGLAAIPLILVVAEPDLGVTILLLALLAGLIALSGVKLRWLAGLAVVGVGGLVGIAKLHLLKAYQVSRLTSFLHPSADPRGTGYSAYQAKISIGSGGLFGQGLFHGPLVAGNFVPENWTDFIFTVAGEELGLVGCLVIIALLGVLLLRAVRIAQKADDQFGMLVAGGIAIWFAVQSFINIGMTIGIMPVTGLPLPFVSYGGSAIFADMIAIGCLQAVYRHRSVFRG